LGRKVSIKANKVLAPAALLALSLLTAGCWFSLPKDLYTLHGMESKCTELDSDRLAEQIASFGPTTPTAELNCALWQLRTMRPGGIHQTAAPAKVCFLLADRHTDPTDRERLAAEGVRWAEIALDGDPRLALYGIRGDNSPEEGRVSYYLAVNLGIAVRDHTALAVKNLKKLAAELRKAVRLCPGEDQGGPLRVLGLLYLVAPPWPQGIGDGDKALTLLEQAAKHYPDHPLNHVFYAQALWELEEGEAKVKKELERGRQLLNDGRWGGAKQRWQKLLMDLAKEADIKLIPLDGPPPPADEQPAGDQQPATDKQPAADKQPATDKQPAADKQPATNEQPAADNQPAADKQQ